MSYFVIAYDRASGHLEIKEFESHAREQAILTRFQREVETLSDRNVEIVLLEADSLEDLHRTHSRYFETFHDIAQRGAAAV